VSERLAVKDERFLEILEVEADLEVVASGFEFTEGPVWNPQRGELIFSDIVGNCMYRWTPEGGVSEFRRPSQMANGSTLDRQGRLLTCEHATSRVTRLETDGSLSVLAANYDGLELNSPNDIVVRSDGLVCFSDPNFGRRPRVGVPRPQQQPVQGVYCFDPGTHELRRVAGDFGNPNGLCFSLDESRLFVNDSPRGHIRVFSVHSDGALEGGGVWAEVLGSGKGVPDGMKIDCQERLYCCGPGGIHVFDQAGRELGVIWVPEQTANFTWGGPDLRTLYITASTTLYRLAVKVPGLPWQPANSGGDQG
jgi:gluconolactonase